MVDETTALGDFTALIAARFGLARAVVIGSGAGAQELAATLEPTLRTILWREQHPPGPPLSELLSAAVVVAHDLAAADPPDALRRTADAGAQAPLLVVRATGWAPARLRRTLADAGLTVSFSGMFRGAALAVVDRDGPARPAGAPPWFRVTAIVPAYNESDIIETAMRRLLHHVDHVLVVENWSDDGTFELLGDMDDGGRLRVTRFPSDGPPVHQEWQAIVDHVVELGGEEGSDWILLCDVDSYIEGPWGPGSLRDALYEVQRRGFNAIDQTVVNFRPVDDLPAGADVEGHMRHFEFGSKPGAFMRVRGWKTAAAVVSINHGGHEATFDGRRVFPFKFLEKHYPIRGQAHGERKVLSDRVPRWGPAGRARGWHHHYNHVAPGHNFIRAPDTLVRFEPERFAEDYVIERLTGAGLTRES